MQSRNPILGQRSAFGQGTQQGWTPSAGHLQQMYDQPAYAPPTAERTMTLDDVVVRSFMVLGTLIVSAAVAWVLAFPIAVALPAMLVGLVLALVISFKQMASPGLILTFAVCYGVAVGVISSWYTMAFGNTIVPQALVGTAMAFAGMLTVYKLRIIRVTPKFTRFVIGAGFALFGLMVVNLLMGVFGVEGGIGIRDAGNPLAYIFSIAAILIGCLFLLLDFNMIEEGVKAGAPQKFAWLCAFGLTVTLVWIYLEMLRFISYFMSE